MSKGLDALKELKPLQLHGHRNQGEWYGQDCAIGETEQYGIIEEALKRIELLEKTLASIKAICNKPSETWIMSLAEVSKRYTGIDNLINTFEDGLE